jgi:hypothetical protein
LATRIWILTAKRVGLKPGEMERYLVDQKKSAVFFIMPTQPGVP